MSDYYMHEHRIGYAVGHFLKAVREGDRPKKPSALRRLLEFDFFKSESGAFKEKIDFVRKASVHDERGSDILALAVKEKAQRDGLSLKEAFVAVARQVGWQTRNTDFEGGHSNSPLISNYQRYLIDLDNSQFEALREWLADHGRFRVFAELGRAAKKLELWSSKVLFLNYIKSLHPAFLLT